MDRKHLYRLAALDAELQSRAAPPAPVKPTRKRRKLRQIMADLVRAAKA